MRLFVAIEVAEPIKRQMLQVQQHLQTAGSTVRWCTADQLHLTLKFIGETAEPTVQPVAEAVRRVAAATPPFHLDIGGSGCFPGSGAVRVIWIGGGDDSGVLRSAVGRLEDALSDLGIPKEKRTFSEHFTIGRVKSDPSRGRLREAVAGLRFDVCRQEVTEFVLLRSELTPRGARYSVVTRAALSG